MNLTAVAKDLFTGIRTVYAGNDLNALQQAAQSASTPTSAFVLLEVSGTAAKAEKLAADASEIAAQLKGVKIFSPAGLFDLAMDMPKIEADLQG